MSDQLFPSGPWTGFYNYGVPADKRRMDLDLTFSNGRMTGDGADDVGRFVIAGQYDSGSLECLWTKTYPGSHDVSYRGFRDGKGIWGTWEIKSDCRGGFHIWPRGSGEGAANKKEFAEPKPAEAVAEPELATVEK